MFFSLFPVSYLPAAEVDADELIRRLASGDFETREKATVALSERAGELWDKLVQASRSPDLEVSTRAKRALAEPTQRGLAALLEKTNTDLAAAEKAVVAENTAELKAAHEQEQAQIKLELEAEALAAHLRMTNSHEDADRKALEAKQEAARKAGEELAKARLEHQTKQEAQKKAFERRREMLRSRQTQLKSLIDLRECLGRGPLKEWEPKLLPFERRLRLPVSFEFDGTPLGEALARMTELVQVKIVRDEEVRDNNTPITLTVNDMSAALALDWICRLANLSYRSEKEAGQVTVVKEELSGE